MFVEILLLAQLSGALKLGHVSVDGSKIHADASKSHAVSYQRLLKLETLLQGEVKALFALAERADQGALVEGVSLDDEIEFRQARLARLAKAKVALEARAEERYQAEWSAYPEKLQERERQAQETQSKPRGMPPQSPEAGPRDKDQYHFTDPDSRIMKNSTHQGLDQHDNVQIAVDQQSLLIVANIVSQAANDQQEAVPTVDAVDARLGQPAAAALDNGYFSQQNITALEQRHIEPYIATGRQSHHRSWQDYFKKNSAPPSAEASAKEKRA